MDSLILDGKALADRIQQDLRSEVENFRLTTGRAPGLAVVLVGSNPASQVYVKSKTKKAIECGIAVEDRKLPESVSNEALQRELRELNADPNIDGILLQLPLPSGLDEFAALTTIAPEKDVDGLHPYNQGLLLRGVGHLRPCTPVGVMALIDEANSQLGRPMDLSGKHAVIVGRSILVGKPMALLLLERHCTVEIAHSRTKNLETVCQRADILVAAIGRPRALGARHAARGSLVLDVGINRLADGALCGDVDYEQVLGQAAAITPVPRGVGPMTIAMLLKNTVRAARQRSARC